MNDHMHIEDHQNTKIVATVGPACSSPEMLHKLMHAGVDVFRLNFSHGSHADHEEVIHRVLKLNEEHNVNIGILVDLQGPKIRVGKMKDETLELKQGDVLTFVNEECLGTMEKIYMSYEPFASDVSVGERVLVDDGKLILEVIETNQKDMVRLKVLFGNSISSNKGVNLPDTAISQPAMTEKDHLDLQFALQFPIHWVALSFVRSAKDMKNLRAIIEERGHSAKTIAKIEKPEAVKHIDQIIKASNAIMIARGDLGVEVPMEQLPSIQKRIIKKCIQRARPVIVATQMMDSMITSPTPTRAEISDVANAVLDGADAVMLSGETSVGAHPVTVVEAMNKILAETEKSYSMEGKSPKLSKKSGTFLSDTICAAAAKIAENIGAKAIIGLTMSGYTAFRVSSHRPPCKIYIFSEKRQILSTLNLVWGVRCFYYDGFANTEETIYDVVELLKKSNQVEKGELLVNTGIMPLADRGRTNLVKITVVD